jgi:F-type H+-transporting ATPase subunit delta
MAEIVTVARPYAEAVFRTALERKSLAAVSEGLQVLAAIARDPQAVSVVGNPKVSPEQKKDLFLSVGGARLDETVKSLFGVLVDGHREVLIGSIQEQFEELKRDHERVVIATITSAQPLSDEQKANIVSALESRYGKRVEAEVAVDPELLGGARVQVGDQVIHASVRDALAQMAAALTR